MMTQTVTRATESETERETLFQFLCEVENIPQWAPVFADRVERLSGGRCLVTKNEGSFEFELIASRKTGTVDYVREMPGGKRGGAYIRVTPRPLGGSSIVMTVPVGPDVTPESVGKVLEEELEELVRLTQ